MNDINKTQNQETSDNELDTRVIQTFHGSVMSLNEKRASSKNAFLAMVVGILKEMTDFRLLCQNFLFLFITLSNFFLFLGFITPFLYIKSIAESHGVSTSQATFLISINGKLFFH